MKVLYTCLLAIFLTGISSHSLAQNGSAYISFQVVLDNPETFQFNPLQATVDLPIKDYFFAGGFAGYANYRYSRTHYYTSGVRFGVMLLPIAQKVFGDKWAVEGLQVYLGGMMGVSDLLNFRQEGYYGHQRYGGLLLGARYNLASIVHFNFEGGRMVDGTYGISSGFSFEIGGKKP